MSESLGYNQDQARILEFRPHSLGDVKFQIDAETKGRDIIATLAYLQPDRDELARQYKRLLHCLLEIVVRQEGSPALLRDRVRAMGQVTSAYGVMIDDQASLKSLDNDLDILYGEEQVPEIKQAMLQKLIDKGSFDGVIIRTTQANEFLIASDDQVAREMRQLTNEFRS
jgi:hypothetical protein